MTGLAVMRALRVLKALVTLELRPLDENGRPVGDVKPLLCERDALGGREVLRRPVRCGGRIAR